MSARRPPTERPFRILGVQQIAVGGPDKRPLLHLWAELLGLPRVGAYKNAAENVDEDILQVGTGSAKVEIDLMQPIDIEGSPKVHVPPLNHIGLWVDDVDRAFAWLSDQGVRFAPGGIRQGASGQRVCFIHPKASQEAPYSGQGVLIELVQAPASLLQTGLPDDEG